MSAPLPIKRLIDQAVERLLANDGEGGRLLAEEALRLAPESPDAICAMGLVETFDQNHDKARAHYQQALAARPDCAEYRVNLAHNLIVRGDFETARAELLRALELDPANAAAFQNLAWITKASKGDSVIDRLRDRKQRAPRGSEDYIKLSFALAKWYDDIGEYDLAFAAANDANLCQADLYDPWRHERFFADVKKIWTRSYFERHRDHGHRSRKPVFIVGMPRSGSTLLEDRLCLHPEVAGLGERSDIIRMVGSMQQGHPARARFPHWCLDVPPGRYALLGRDYVQKYEALHPSAERLVNKALLNYAYVGMVAAMLPEALVIDVRRNALDTCLSCYFKDLTSAHQYAVRLHSLAHLYRLYVDVMEHWRSVVDRLEFVRYESLVADPDAVTARSIRAMGLDPARDSADANARPIQTFSAWQVRQPVSSSAIGRWRNYEKHLGPLIDALGDLAER